ncbi:hypothetical protein [Sphingobium sp. HDIP04]|uniref:hypothetical protein n=1 Tax=Sphingobium sp. HDIP04 TaxID=428994 RepID=UPI00042699F7|nr:hypothetical protein [Sphingobium sp. HDIP04]
MSTIPFCTQEMADEAVYLALSLFIGDGRRYSVDDIEAGIPGMKARTVSSWIAHSLENRRAPKARDLLRIAHFLGKDGPLFMSKVMGRIGMGAHSLTPQPGDPGVVIATLAQGVSQFAIRGADNRFCHVDQGELEPVADHLIATLVPFSSKGR